MDSRTLIEEVERRLLLVYQSPRHGNPTEPVDETVYIILSMQTEDYLYMKVYEILRMKISSWEDLLQLSVDQLADMIAYGGLQNKKAGYIKGALRKIKDDFGELSLDKLDKLSDGAVLKYLMSLPGIGEKGARCIMMYTMNRQVFPVDTHIWRISRRLGLTPKTSKASSKHQRELEDKIPRALRYSLHVNMIAHGREICLPYWPKCNECVLKDLCPSKGVPDTVWGDWRNPQGFWANYHEPKATEAK